MSKITEEDRDIRIAILKAECDRLRRELESTLHRLELIQAMPINHGETHERTEP